MVYPYAGTHRKTSSLLLQQGPEYLGWCVRLEASCLTAVVSWRDVSRIYSKWHAASLCNSRLAFSPRVLLNSGWCSHAIVQTRHFLPSHFCSLILLFILSFSLFPYPRKELPSFLHSFFPSFFLRPSFSIPFFRWGYFYSIFCGGRKWEELFPSFLLSNLRR